MPGETASNMSNANMNGNITAQNIVINVSFDPQHVTHLHTTEMNIRTPFTINGNITAENFVINLTPVLRQKGDHHTTM